MALSGIQIYKLLPQTNCKDCGLPTCLAFAMKLAAEQVELDKCPHVSDEARETLAGRAAPPAVFDMRGQTVGTQVNVGGDYVDRRSTVIVGGGNREAGGG
jgi:acetyl-CoA decarbonylase/synthase complex subunit gamma